MLFESFRKLLGSKRDKKARRKMFVPQVDVLEDRRLLAAVTRFVDDSYTPGQLNATHFNSIQVAVTAAQKVFEVAQLETQAAANHFCCPRHIFQPQRGHGDGRRPNRD